MHKVLRPFVKAGVSNGPQAACGPWAILVQTARSPKEQKRWMNILYIPLLELWVWAITNIRTLLRPTVVKGLPTTALKHKGLKSPIENYFPTGILKLLLHHLYINRSHIPGEKSKILYGFKKAAKKTNFRFVTWPKFENPFLIGIFLFNLTQLGEVHVGNTFYMAGLKFKFGNFTS